MQGTIRGRDPLQPRSLADELKMLGNEGLLVPLAGFIDLYVSLNFGTLKATRFLDLAQAIAKIVIAGVQGREPLLAMGSVGPVPLRLWQTERALGSGASLAEAQENLQCEIAPIDDLQSTAEYRRQVAANLVAQFWNSRSGTTPGR